MFNVNIYMSDGISFFSNDELQKHVKTVMVQTNYTEEQAIEYAELMKQTFIKHWEARKNIS